MLDISPTASDLGERRAGRETNEHLANILQGVVERCHQLWGNEEDEID